MISYQCSGWCSLSSQVKCSLKKFAVSGPVQVSWWCHLLSAGICKAAFLIVHFSGFAWCGIPEVLQASCITVIQIQSLQLLI